MKIIIRTLNEIKFEVDLGDENTVVKLKNEVAKITGIEYGKQRLLYGGKQVTPSRELLSEYGIVDGSVICTTASLQLRTPNPKIDKAQIYEHCKLETDSKKCALM